MNILIVQNCEIESLGLYEDYLSHNGFEHVVARPYRESLPPLSSFDAVLVGGTPDAAYHKDDFPYLATVFRMLGEVVRTSTPCLGVCGGAQLLAAALGAAVYPNRTKEIGVYDVSMTEAGRSDPLLDGFPDPFPVFHWHGDTFDVPRRATLLATGKDCQNQMFRYGTLVGVQFHLEVTPGEAARWAGAYHGELKDFGKTAEQIAAECAAVESRLRKLAGVFMTNYFNLLTESR